MRLCLFVDPMKKATSRSLFVFLIAYLPKEGKWMSYFLGVLLNVQVWHWCVMLLTRLNLGYRTNIPIVLRLLNLPDSLRYFTSVTTLDISICFSDTLPTRPSRIDAENITDTSILLRWSLGENSITPIEYFNINMTLVSNLKHPAENKDALKGNFENDFTTKKFKVKGNLRYCKYGCRDSFLDARGILKIIFIIHSFLGLHRVP